MMNLRKLICKNLSLKTNNLKFTLIDSRRIERNKVTFQLQNLY